jgi:hypothetical protein
MGGLSRFDGDDALDEATEEATMASARVVSVIPVRKSLNVAELGEGLVVAFWIPRPRTGIVAVFGTTGLAIVVCWGNWADLLLSVMCVDRV